MKKNVKTLLLYFCAVIFPLAFLACNFSDISSNSDSDSESYSSGYETVLATDSNEWNYDSSESVFLVSDDVSSLEISGKIGGKTLYFVQANPTSTAFSSDDLRIAKASQKLNLLGSSSSSRAGQSENSEEKLTFQNNETDENLLKIKHFSGETFDFPFARVSARSASSTGGGEASLQSAEKEWSVGDSKSIYVDTDSGMETFEQKTATLRAKNDVCYVWVVDDYYSQSASGSSVDSSIAESFASKFAEIYPCITNVFGDEADEIINYGTEQLVDMESLSDTGSKINIVVYDIGADYGASDSSGIVGYFYSKDYYYVPSGTQVSNEILNKSNAGKYFYVDSAFANSHFSTTVSTLAHEFQHMINFNQKYLKSLKKCLAGTSSEILSSDTAYNEMLSMLCEDMMQEKLVLEDDDSPKGRIKNFNACYYMSGMREYRSDDYASLSYSTAYALGSFLARQYGGAALVSKISQNEYVGNDSIVNAVNSLNKTSKSFDDLFAEFIAAVTGISSSHSEKFTHNQDAAQTMTYNSYSYPMTAFDLWGDSFSLKDTEFYAKYKKYAYSEYDGNGPFVFSRLATVSELRPEYGIMIHAVGKYDSSVVSDTLTFSSSGAKGLRLYIVIQ